MSDIVMHDMTKREYDALVAHPTHAIVIIGPDGSGKTWVGRHLAASMLHIDFSKLSNYAYYAHWQPDEKGSLRVEHAQEIVRSMKLKTTGTEPIRRVILIENADTMTIDAQNTLLKLIEEPPEDSVIILTAPTETSLLPTIMSRAQRLVIRKPPKQQLLSHDVDSDVLGPDEHERIYLLSNGLPGLYYSMVQGATEHPVVTMIQAAKEIIGADVFTRLQAIDNYTKRADAERLVAALAQVARSGLGANVTRINENAVRRWHAMLVHAVEAQIQLAGNGSPKLVLTNLFLHM